MSTEPYALVSTAERQVLPAIGSEGSSSTFWRSFIDRRIYYQHRLRSRDVARWRRAELYDQCIQWLMRAQAGYDVGATTSQWVEAYWNKGNPNWIPTPVFNEGLAARQNESARLAAPNPRPKITPREQKARLETRMGAKRATDSLRHRLKEMGWEREAWLIYYHMPLYGGAILCSEWEERWDETTMVPAVGAAVCPQPQCGFVLADPENHPEIGGRCPRCPEHPQLQPFQPTLEEASGGLTDALGQPLGKEQPLGNWKMSVKSPYDVFFANLGIGRHPHANELVEVSVETLDEIAVRWPDKADKIQPESAAALARFHPVVGAPDVYHSVLDAHVFRDSARVKRWVRPPWMERLRDENGEFVRKLNRGRVVTMCGDVLLEDVPFEMDSLVHEGETFPRMHYEYIPWEYRDGGHRIQGMGLWDIIFYAQDTRNEVISQTQSVRQRLAVPIYAVLRRNNFSITQLRGGVPGRMAAFEPDPEAPNFVPKLINNEVINPGVAQEGADALDFIERAGLLREVEKGGVPSGVSAAQAIRLLKESASEGRQPRVDRINQATRRCFEHGAQLQNHMYLEPREYKYESEDGEEMWTAAKSLDFAGQTDVVIEAEPTFDEKLKNLETVREFISILMPDAGRGTRRKILKHLDIPQDIMEDEKYQEAAAQREWMSFRDEGRVPIVDPGLDSHADHHEEHGQRCHSEHFRKLEQVAGWDEALKILSGTWRMSLQMILYQPAAESFQDRIIADWGMKLLQAQFQPQDPMALQKVLQWRAHMEAHRLHEEFAQIQAMQGPTLAQPGADETSSGTQAAPGQAPTQGPQ